MRREHILQNGGSILPAGYTLLKYLGNTGYVSSNYIQTDFNSLSTFVIRGEFSYYSNIGAGDSGTWICGNNASGSLRQGFTAFFRSNGMCAMDTVFGSYVSSGLSLSDSVIDTDKVWNFEVSRTKIEIDGQTFSRSYSSGSDNYKFNLFKADNYNTGSRTIKHRLYWLSISDITTDALLHYFYPAKNDSNSALGVYDIVTDKFYSASGSNWTYEI